MAVSDRALRRLAWLSFALAASVFVASVLFAAVNWPNLPAQFQGWQEWLLSPWV